MASGVVEIKHFADGSCGIDITLGPTQGGTANAPFIIRDNNGNVLALINTLGNVNISGLLLKQQQVAGPAGAVMAAGDVNFFVDTSAGSSSITLVNPGGTSQGSNLGILSRTVRVFKTSVDTNTVTVTVVSGGGINNQAALVLEEFGESVELATMPLSATTGQWFVVSSGKRVQQIKTTAVTPYVPVWSDDVVMLDATAGAFAVNLPLANATTRLGRVLTLKKMDGSANAVTINRAGADTIQGAATLVLAAQWDGTRLQPDGATTWIVV